MYQPTARPQTCGAAPVTGSAQTCFLETSKPWTGRPLVAGLMVVPALMRSYLCLWLACCALHVYVVGREGVFTD